MKIERLCGWHGVTLDRRSSVVFLTLGYVMIIFRRRAS